MTNILQHPEKRLAEIFLQEIKGEPYISIGKQQQVMIGLIMDTALALFAEEKEKAVKAGTEEFIKSGFKTTF